jgi:hypothetical protein
MKYNPENKKKYSQLVVKAWTDERFKKRLIEHPKDVFKEFSLYSDIAHPKIVENTNDVTYFILPKKPSQTLSEQELKDLAAGATSGNECC